MAKKAPKALRSGPTKAKREEIANAARTAWLAILSGDGDRWPYWEAVCPCLKLCRDDAMREVGLDPRTRQTPTNNGRYNDAMTRALRAIGLHQIPKSSRKAGIECAPHLKEIGSWRDELRKSTYEKERTQYLALNHPQKVWADFKKWKGWEEQKQNKEKKFVDHKVRDALGLADNGLCQNLAALLPATRIYSIASGLLSRMEVPLRPILADSLDVPSDARANAVLALLDKLQWDTSERSRLADAVGFDPPRRNAPLPVEASAEEIAKYIGTQLSLTDEAIRELADMMLSRIDENWSRSTSTAWGHPDRVANEMAVLRERLRNAEAQLERHEREQEADHADPVPKVRYKESANEADRQRREASERIRMLEADRDRWRSRYRSEVEAQYAARAVAAAQERDQAVAARDQALIELIAARAQIAALTNGDGRDDNTTR